MPKIEYERVGEYLKTAFKVISENDDSLRSREVIQQVGRRLNLSDHELERHEKSGYVRWESILHFYSINAVKAEWIKKNGGIWYLTPEGKKVSNLSAIDLFNLANEKYAEWKDRQPKTESTAEEVEDPGEAAINPLVTFDTAESAANDGIESFVSGRDGYEFQDLVAALLRAMGYHTPFIAPRGPDGGIDVVAYSDPLGTNAPRITVQVKQRPDTKASVQEMRELSGLLRRDGDTGLFVSTGGFSKDALAEANNAIRHIETMDLQRFIDLWKQYYPQMPEEDKKLLPLREILFHAPSN